MNSDAYFMNEAIKEAEKSLSEGGIPIGAVLVKDGQVISRGHNRLIQKGSVILHGEMDAIELRETTMSKKNRILKQVTVEDAMAADAAFELLMSDNVEPRRNFIVENAGYVENLDI